MMINLKQQELIEQMINRVKEKYPEIKVRNLETSPDDPEHIWVNVIADMNENKEIQLQRFSSKLALNILMKYGYRISIMTENPNLIYA